MASDWKSQCFEDPGALEPNPDIGGIGVSDCRVDFKDRFSKKLLQVYIGFVGTAWFSVLLVVLHFLFVFEPSENPFANEIANPSESPNASARAPNHVDVVALKMLQVRRFRSEPRPSGSHGKRPAILMQVFDIKHAILSTAAPS